MILVVVERDPQVAVDSELAEFRVHAHSRPFLFAQPPHVVDQARSRLGPLFERLLQGDAVEVPLVVRVVLELGTVSGGHGPDARLEAFSLRGREVSGDVTERPRPDAVGRVVGDELRHRDEELLAGLELFEKVAHEDWSGYMIRDLGLAASSSVITAVSTSSGEPGRSSTGPQRQPSRYASMSVEPSFIAYASIAA